MRKAIPAPAPRETAPATADTGRKSSKIRGTRDAEPSRAELVYERLGPQGAARRRSGGAIVQPAARDQMNVPLAVYHRIRMFVATVRL
jgi:hypothetical protein